MAARVLTDPVAMKEGAPMRYKELYETSETRVKDSSAFPFLFMDHPFYFIWSLIRKKFDQAYVIPDWTVTKSRISARFPLMLSSENEVMKAKVTHIDLGQMEIEDIVL